MREIIRTDVNEEWAHSGMVEAGDFAFINYCVGNIGQSIENQINGALDHLEARLRTIGLTLDNVVKVDYRMRDIWNIPVLEKVFKERFNGKYPVRAGVETNFAHIGGQEGLHFQLDAIAFKG